MWSLLHSLFFRPNPFSSLKWAPRLRWYHLTICVRVDCWSQLDFGSCLGSYASGFKTRSNPSSYLHLPTHSSSCRISDPQNMWRSRHGTWSFCRLWGHAAREVDIAFQTSHNETWGVAASPSFTVRLKKAMVFATCAKCGNHAFGLWAVYCVFYSTYRIWSQHVWLWLDTKTLEDCLKQLLMNSLLILMRI